MLYTSFYFGADSKHVTRIFLVGITNHNKNKNHGRNSCHPRSQCHETAKGRGKTQSFSASAKDMRDNMISRAVSLLSEANNVVVLGPISKIKNVQYSLQRSVPGPTVDHLKSLWCENAPFPYPISLSNSKIEQISTNHLSSTK
jgi:hypothetical protein